MKPKLKATVEGVDQQDLCLINEYHTNTGLHGHFVLGTIESWSD